MLQCKIPTEACSICRPFERKSKENMALFKHLQHFPQIADQVSPQVLKELCAVAQLDKWNDDGFTGTLHLT